MECIRVKELIGSLIGTMLCCCKCVKSYFGLNQTTTFYIKKTNKVVFSFAYEVSFSKDK